MHEHIVQVSMLGLLIWYCCKPGKPLFKNVDSHWVDAIKQDVYSEVKFQPIYQERVLNVMLSNHVVMGVYILPILSKEYSLALAHALRLNYEYRIFLPNIIVFGSSRTSRIFAFLFVLVWIF